VRKLNKNQNTKTQRNPTALGGIQHSRSTEPVRWRNGRTTTRRDRGTASAVGAHPFEQLRTGRATRPMKKGIKSVKIVDALCNVMTTGCDRGSYHFISYHGTHSRTRPKMCCFFSLSLRSPRDEHYHPKSTPMITVLGRLSFFFFFPSPRPYSPRKQKQRVRISKSVARAFYYHVWRR
jgi:hypothetical protein